MLTGPDKYELSLTPSTYKVGRKFSGLATRKIPKLYVVIAKGRVVYVGITRQIMSSRLRYGFTATGKHGYHGYACLIVSPAIRNSARWRSFFEWSRL
jgi:hypothetical protein